MLGLLLQIARVFALLSLVSIGRANAVLPEIRRRVVVVRGWMSDAAIANLFTISHAASGPNIIMVSLVGWQLAGLAELLVATLAIMLPSACLHRRTFDRPLVGATAGRSSCDKDSFRWHWA
jgi:chromate transporter